MRKLDSKTFYFLLSQMLFTNFLQMCSETFYHQNKLQNLFLMTHHRSFLFVNREIVKSFTMEEKKSIGVSCSVAHAVRLEDKMLGTLFPLIATSKLYLNESKRAIGRKTTLSFHTCIAFRFCVVRDIFKVHQKDKKHDTLLQSSYLTQ